MREWCFFFSSHEAAARAVAQLGDAAAFFLWQGDGILWVSPKKERERDALGVLLSEGIILRENS